MHKENVHLNGVPDEGREARGWERKGAVGLAHGGGYVVPSTVIQDTDRHIVGVGLTPCTVCLSLHELHRRCRVIVANLDAVGADFDVAVQEGCTSLYF